MKNTVLHHIHESLGAKMLPFAGYNMPITYEGVNAEHETVRTAVGVFDVSHMGEFLLTGEHALALIQKVTSNDASTLTIGRAQYSCLPNNDGGIVDDLIVYRMKEDQYLLVVNASNIEKDWNWISSHNDLGVDMRNLSDDYSLLAIQGPKAVEAMQALTSVDLSSIAYYHFVVGDFAGFEHVIISATGYTG
jgi:aminomethyltransferase